MNLVMDFLKNKIEQEEFKTIYNQYNEDNDLREGCRDEIEIEWDTDEPYSYKQYPIISNEGHIIKFEVINPKDHIEIQFEDEVICGKNGSCTLDYIARLTKVEYIKEKVIAHYEIRGN